MLTEISVWTMYFFSLYFIIFWFLVFLDKGVRERDPKLKKYPSVTIAIPAYNEGKNIEKTINSVLNLNYPKEKLKLIIVNDGSKDNTKQIVEKIIKNNKQFNILLINQQNQGKGSALNNALKNTSSEFFVTLDADSFVKKSALQILIPHFEKNVAAVLPIIKINDNKSFMERIQSYEYPINFFYKKVMSHLNCIHVTPGPFSVYKTEIIKKINGFDENNLTEDMELALRLQKNNYSIIQILSTEVLTIAPKTFKEFYKQRNRWYKGTIFNLIKYKEMLFNPKYGELGIFFLPMVLLAAITAVSLSVYLTYTLILRPILKWFYDMHFINFNLIPLINKTISSFTPLDINFMNLFFAIIIFAIAILWLIISFKYTKEKIKSPVIFYLFLYPSIMSIIWLGVLFDIIREKS